MVSNPLNRPKIWALGMKSKRRMETNFGMNIVYDARNVAANWAPKLMTELVAVVEVVSCALDGHIAERIMQGEGEGWNFGYRHFVANNQL